MVVQVRLVPLAALVALTGLASCGGAEQVRPLPPVTTASPASGPGQARGGGSSSGTLYRGHGLESVPPEVLARFAPTPIPGDLRRKIQAMLDVRAPIGSRIAPDGKSLYFAWNVTGTFQVWKVDGPRRFPIALTGGEDVTRVVGIFPDGKSLVISRDRKGEENPGLYLLDPKGGALKEIQHKPKVQTQLQFVSDDGKWVYFRANDVKPDSHAIYRYDVARGVRELVFGEDGLWAIEDHLPNGKLLFTRQTGELTREYWEFDEKTKKLTPVFGQNEKEEYEALYANGAEQTGELVVLTSKYGDFRRLYKTKKNGGGPLEKTDVTPIGPERAHDVAMFTLDRAKKNLYFTINEAGYTRPHVLDAKTLAEKKLPLLPGMEGEDHVTFGAPSHDGRYVPVQASAARHATASYILDWETNQLTQWVVPSTPELDPSKFVVASLEHYTARDGTKIPMFVRRSEACVKPAKPCPVVVHFHGGPEGQSVAGLSTYGQVFADAGFVWIEPNVRGSDGYGRTWLHADDGPKRLAIITDIEDAATHARKAFAVNGQAPKVGVFGGSYGGYSTLMAMTKFAGAYDAGVAIVGMSSLTTFLQNTAPYRRQLRISEYGDPEKDKQALVDLSPITYIDRVKSPLLLIQGANDPRVPIGEAVQMYEALERRTAGNGGSGGEKAASAVRMVVFPDEGHGTQKRENKVLEIGYSLDFFETHLMEKKK